MDQVVEFLLRNGYAVLFGVVLAEQIGIPVVTIPVLLAAGALSAHGSFSFPIAMLVALAACYPGDLLWYYLGRLRGRPVLKTICRLSLEPDSCVRRTEDLFTRHGSRVLLIAKLIPAVGGAARPLAGLLGMSLLRFLLFDTAGAIIWFGFFGGIGFVFREQIEEAALFLSRLGRWAIILAAAGLAGYVGWRYLQRRRFLRKIRIARIQPDELRQRLAAGEELTIVDLRHHNERIADPVTLPRAVHITLDKIESRRHEIPPDQDVVLFCT